MAPTSLIHLDACEYCGYPNAKRTLKFANLDPLCLHELPRHDETWDGITEDQRPSLSKFIHGVLSEMYQVKFGDKTWVRLGDFPSSGTRLDVIMPPLSEVRITRPEICVPIQVEKWATNSDSSAWLGRSSYHSALAIAYTELDELLAQDHCRKEGAYTPSVFDANELLRWNEEDLRKAVAEIDEPEWRVSSVQMSIYQMFHEMPKALGISMLQNRVFHVLCITAHSEYIVTCEGVQTPRTQSHTIQLPVHFDSFRDIDAVIGKSHLRKQSRVYDIARLLSVPGSLTERQKKYNGKNVTEGIYGSLERLQHAPLADSPEKEDKMHRWDMMTQSDARGITRVAPWSTKKKEILEAVAKDVQYVLEHIRSQRQEERNIRDTTP